ncbi:MAG: adenylate kinase [Lishizhenia sp.]
MINIKDKQFEVFIEEREIQDSITVLAQEINHFYEGQEVVFIGVLNGAFMFASDLLKQINLKCSISFVKVSSYKGTNSTGIVHELIGVNENLKDKNVVILEDIVDTGLTLDKVRVLLGAEHPKSLKIATLLFKPEAFLGKITPDFIGLHIENKFVVGYGLDYDELGRNTRDIYKLTEENKNMLNIVLFGPPGAGKGTQSERLIEQYNLKHLSTGDIFRANIGGGTDLGKLAKSYIDKGQLVPDEVTINMLQSEVNKHPEAKGFIFDGFPRTNAQAKALDDFLTTQNTSITAMIALDVPENELKERLKKRAESSGRTDDADPKIIENRISVYRKETEPVKAFYQEQNKYIAINGVGTMDEISTRLFAAVDGLK